MKNNIIRGIASAILVLVLASCGSVKTTSSADIEQRIIFPQYFVHYDAADGALIATAKFNENNSVGSAIKLSGSSRVSFNEEELKSETNKKEKSYAYVLRKETDFPKDFIFTYVNNDEQTFSNVIHIMKFEPQKSDLTMSKTGSCRILYNGPECTENETIECVIYHADAEDGQTEIPCYQDTENAHAIVILGEDLDLAEGKYEMQFIRRNSSSEVAAMDRGGIWESEYFSKKIAVDIRP
ncbi:MAG: hypothetical protein MJZ76_01825 [Bacteroidales bacterium]|nr:hypothetical protein [Bacteroidales bacterium]